MKSDQIFRQSGCPALSLSMRASPALMVLIALILWPAFPIWAESLPWQVGEYRVTKGDCLSTISQKLSTSTNALTSINSLVGGTVPVGKILKYPKISPVPKCHRVYTSGGALYLMTYEEHEDRFQNTLSVFKKERHWRLLDKFESPYPPHKMTMFVRDLNNDGNDECYAFREYIGSSKDEGVEAVYHAPEVAERLSGIAINYHAFSIVAQTTEGYPESLITEEQIGLRPGVGSARFQAYVERKARKLLNQ